MADIFEIAGRIHSTSQEKVTTTADEILDESLGMKQNELNAEIASIGAAVQGLNPEQTGALSVAEKANSNEAKIGYYLCDTAASTAGKTVSSTTYTLGLGGSVKIKFEHANTVVSGVTLKIGSAEAKPLYYEGAAVSANNTWEDNETVEVYYNGTNYYANNVAGGSGDGVFDLTAKTGNTYATLADALTAANIVIPASKKKGGMSIKYVHTSDNKYVEYFLHKNTWSVKEGDWEKLNDKEEVDGSDKSIYDEIHSTLFGGNVSADPMNFPVVNAIVSTQNDYRLQGKSNLVDVAGATGISVTSDTSGNITFITGIPTLNPSNNQSVSFAQGESGRRSYNAGTTSFDVPTNAKYALISRETSQGVNVSPSAVQVNRTGDRVFSPFDDIDSVKETGVYKSRSTILLVSNYTTSVVQVNLSPYSSGGTSKAKIRYRVFTDNAWGSWIDYDEATVKSVMDTNRVFSGAFNYAAVDTLITNGIFRVNSYSSTYGFPIVLVRNSNNIVTQVIFIISSSGKFFIRTRQSTDNGSTWSDWEDYLKDINTINNHLNDIDSNLQFLNNEYERTEIDISGLTIVDASITSGNQWKPYAPNVAGKSFIIDCASFEKIIITTTVASNISFLESLPPSFDNTISAKFADGESGRRSVAVGENIFTVPLGANYIAYSCKTSSGADISPSKIEIVNTIALLRANNFTKKVVGAHGQVIDNGVIYLENMSNVVPVSDPLKAFASGECNVYHEPETGLVYFTCIEGFDHPYEASDCVSLYVFSLTNPHNVKRFQIAKASDRGNNVKCYTPNLLYLGMRNVRVFYTIQSESDTDGAYLYYKDFDFSTETFSAESKVKTTDLNDLTASAIRQFTIDEGGVDTGRTYVYIQKITDVAEDGYRYCTLNCGESTDYNIVVARSNDDFETIELVCITPFRLRYDCAIGVLDAKLYFVYRVAGDEYASTSGTSLCTAEISNGELVNWSTPVKFAEGDSRPDCYTYKNKVYMMAGNYHSLGGKPMRVSSSVWEGVSDDPAEYTKVLVVSDTRGVQNPRVFRYGCGDYGILMGDSPARVDYPDREATGRLQWQFKTAVCFVCSRIN